MGPLVAREEIKPACGRWGHEFLRRRGKKLAAKFEAVKAGDFRQAAEMQRKLRTLPSMPRGAKRTICPKRKNYRDRSGRSFCGVS